MSSWTQAFKPRDRVFSLLGIAKDAEELKIQVGYSRSEEQVFIDATINFRSQDNLHVFSFCQSSEHASILPSWVPNWSARMDPNPLLHAKEYRKSYHSASGEPNYV